MEFMVNLIRAKSETPEQQEELVVNCTHIIHDYWFMEGDVDCLRDCGIEVDLLDEMVVPGLGDMSQDELIDLAGIRDDLDIE